MRLKMLIAAVLCSMLNLSIANGQAPAEPPAPAPSAAVKTLLDDAAKALQANKPEDTLKVAEQALAAARDAKDAAGEASALRSKALSLTRLNRAEDAAESWKLAAEAWDRAGDGPGQVEALGDAGALLIVAKPEEAKGLLDRALSQAKLETKRPLAAAAALHAAGVAMYNQARLVEPGALWKLALSIRERLEPNSLEVAASLNNLGNVARDQGDLSTAEDYHKRALAIRESLAPGSLHVAGSLNNLGNVSYFKGDLTAAEGYFTRALAIQQKLAPDSEDVADSLNNLGAATSNRGDLSAAQDYYKRALAIDEKLAPNSLIVASRFINLGNVGLRRGDLSEAEEYYSRARSIQEKLAPGTLDLAVSHHCLGSVAYKRGDLPAADLYFKRGLAIREKLAPDSLEVAGSLTNIGVVAADQGDLSAGEAYYKRALAIQERLAPGSLDVAVSLNNLGRVAADRTNFPAAVDYYKRALIIQENLAPESMDVASSLGGLGNVAFRQGNVLAADRWYKRALTIQERLAPNSLEEADNLFNRSSVASNRGQLPQALRLMQRAWMIIRQQAKSVSGDEALQSFGVSRASYAGNLLGYQMALNQPGAAIITLEQGRAQALQQQLVERRLLAGTKNKNQWRTYEKAARERDMAIASSSDASSAEAQAARGLTAAKDPAKRTPPTEIARLETALKDATTAFETAQTTYTRKRVEAENAWKEIKAANPRAFAPELTVAQLQHALPPGTLYAAFSVGEDRSHLLLLRAGRPVQAFVLPLKQKDLEARVKELRADLADSLSDRNRLDAKSRRLFGVLFPAEARKEIVAASHLMISPDGPLWQLPFAALVMPGSNYLGAAKPITYTQSLSLFAQTRHDARHLARGQKPVAVVLGDPVFVRGQAVASTSTVSVVASNTVERVFSGERGYLWDKSAPPQRLPKTRDEALKIATLYHAAPLLGEQATESELRKRMERADVLHLATHGYFHPKVAMASGLLLTPPEKEPAIGETDNDGALQAWEIFSQLHLRAELVVLSACETGLGRNVAGEGVIGLTRALQYAGCRSIVSSQWRVDDSSAAGLMVAFHKNLRQGFTKDESLRRAMAQVRSDRKTSHPYYWAAFFLTGDPDNPNLGARR